MPMPVPESSPSLQSDRSELIRVTKDIKQKDGQPIKGSAHDDRLPVVKRITAAMNRLSQDTTAKKEEKKVPVKMAVTKGMIAITK